MARDVHITWRTEDGAEHDEAWASIEAFRTWALGEGLRCRYSAYQAEDDDDEDELVLLERGSVP